MLVTITFHLASSQDIVTEAHKEHARPVQLDYYGPAKPRVWTYEVQEATQSGPEGTWRNHVYVTSAKARKECNPVYHEYHCKHLRYSVKRTAETAKAGMGSPHGDDHFKEDVYTAPRQWARQHRTACGACSRLPKSMQRCEH